MAKTWTWVCGALLAGILAGCGDGGSGSSGPSDPGDPPGGDRPTSAQPGVPPGGGSAPGNPGNPTDHQPPTGGGPGTVNPPNGGATPTLGKLPWDRRGGPDRPRTADGIPGGFSNVPRPDRPETPTSPDPRLHGVGTTPNAGGPPVEPGDEPGDDGPTVPGGSGGAGTTKADRHAPGGPEDFPPPTPDAANDPGAGPSTKVDRRGGGGPTEQPLPPLDRLIPGSDVPSVFTPRPGTDGPTRPPKPAHPGETPEVVNQPRPDGEGRRPGEPVPEPQTVVLYVVGGAFLVWTYRKNAARAAAVRIASR